MLFSSAATAHIQANARNLLFCLKVILSHFLGAFVLFSGEILVNNEIIHLHCILANKHSICTAEICLNFFPVAGNCWQPLTEKDGAVFLSPSPTGPSFTLQLFSFYSVGYFIFVDSDLFLLLQAAYSIVFLSKPAPFFLPRTQMGGKNTIIVSHKPPMVAHRGQ